MSIAQLLVLPLTQTGLAPSRLAGSGRRRHLHGHGQVRAGDTRASGIVENNAAVSKEGGRAWLERGEGVGEPRSSQQKACLVPHAA
jgi:hypothetical protein